MAEFRVKWEMDISAADPQAAALAALAAMKTPGSWANVFDVTAEDGTETRVDLIELETAPATPHQDDEPQGPFAVIYDRQSDGETVEEFYEVFDTPAEAHKMFRDAFPADAENRHGYEVTENPRLVKILGPIDDYATSKESAR